MTNNKDEDRVAQLLEQAVNLLGILATKGLPEPGVTQKEQIRILASAGLQSKQIADLLGTTPGTVSVRLSEARSTGRKDKVTKVTKKQ